MRIRTTLLPLAALVLLAGCGDDSPSSTTTSAPSTTTSIAASTSTSSGASTTSSTAAFAGTPAAGVDVKHICTVITIADLNRTLNGGYEQTNAPTDEDGCTYYTKAGANAGRAQASLDVTLSGAKATWDPSGAPAVAGVGDAAYSSRRGELNVIEALKGDTKIELAVGNGVTATDDQLKTLANLAFQRLGV